MNVECYPVPVLPHLSRLFVDYVGDSAAEWVKLSSFFAGRPFANSWMQRGDSAEGASRVEIAGLLEIQNEQFGAGPETLANIERLRNGANVVVTGQQVSLLGGPLFTLLKAATAIRKAKDATAAGIDTVPVFWLATEDHDLDEVNQVQLAIQGKLETLSLELGGTDSRPVGGIALGDGITALLDRAEESLGYSTAMDLLRESYAPGTTFGAAMGKFIARVFAAYGLIVIDPAGREFHALAKPVLRAAIERADELHSALLERSEELVAAGYHAQVLVEAGSSLLFLIDTESGARTALKRTASGWKAGGRQYSTKELLEILEESPERLSPNALLRPVMQDYLLPVTAYVGGPAEIAYFAQSQVIYERVLGRTTPILPRLTATLIEPALKKIMARQELSLPQVFTTADELAQRLGARAIPIEGKKKLQTAGNSLDRELTELTGWMETMDAGLGRSAAVAASKMRYQMNRLRRLAARFMLEKEASLKKQAEALALGLYPGGNLQERVIAGAYFLARFGDGLPELLVETAAQECPGHRAIEPEA